jgi:hypothetical protein
VGADGTARAHAEEFVPAVKDLVKKVLILYKDTPMPKSDAGWPPAT